MSNFYAEAVSDSFTSCFKFGVFVFDVCFVVFKRVVWQTVRIDARS